MGTGGIGVTGIGVWATNGVGVLVKVGVGVCMGFGVCVGVDTKPNHSTVLSERTGADCFPVSAWLRIPT